MASIASKEERRRSRTVFLCHCDRSFPTPALLSRHAYQRHQQDVLTLKAFLTSSSQIYQISRFNRVRHSPHGNQDHPIEIPDSPLPRQEHRPDPMEQERTNAVPDFLSEILPQAPGFSPKPESPPKEPEEGVGMKEGEQAEGGERTAAKLSQPVKVHKRRGRKPKFLAEILKLDDPAMQRCSEMLGWFMPKLSDSFGLPGLDFRESMSRAHESKLCSQVCRYVASWDIASASDLTAASFPAMRDRLLVLSTLLQGEEAFLRWKEASAVGAGDYFAFFNYFMGNFLPALLLERRTQRWIQTNCAHVLNRSHIVYEEILALLRWWNRNDRTIFAVHRNPLLDFRQVFTAETCMKSSKVHVDPTLDNNE